MQISRRPSLNTEQSTSRYQRQKNKRKVLMVVKERKESIGKYDRRPNSRVGIKTKNELFMFVDILVEDV
jgi:hypothetical protein